MTLHAAPLVAFAATADPDRALAFYRDTLGLTLTADEPFALVFDAHGTMLRVQKVETVTPAPYTVLGWRVADIGAAAKDLAQRGVRFERYAGLEQDRSGLSQSPGSARV